MKYIPASEVEKLRDGIRDLEIIVDGYGPDNLTMQSYERSARETIDALRALLASAVELPGDDKLREVVEEMAGLDCAKSNILECGVCMSCKARAALRKVEEET